MAKFRIKPVTVEAIQWTVENYPEVYQWVKSWTLGESGGMSTVGERLQVSTSQGRATAKRGDWLVYNHESESFGAFSADEFAAAFDPVT